MVPMHPYWMQHLAPLSDLLHPYLLHRQVSLWALSCLSGQLRLYWLHRQVCPGAPLIPSLLLALPLLPLLPLLLAPLFLPPHPLSREPTRLLLIDPLSAHGQPWAAGSSRGHRAESSVE